MFFLTHPQAWINDERMGVQYLKSECIWVYFPSDLGSRIPSALGMSLGLEHLLGLGKSLNPRGCATQYIPLLDSVRILYHCNGIRLPFENSIAQDCSPLITTPLRRHCIIVTSLQRAKSMQSLISSLLWSVSPTHLPLEVRRVPCLLHTYSCPTNGQAPIFSAFTQLNATV